MALVGLAGVIFASLCLLSSGYYYDEALLKKYHSLNLLFKNFYLKNYSYMHLIHHLNFFILKTNKKTIKNFFLKEFSNY